MVAHIRQGGPLFGRSGEYNRLMFAIADGNNTMDIMQTAVLRVYQRERRRIL
jgi:DNA/RNA endonuclease YhcR with UshA esterase domain